MAKSTAARQRSLFADGATAAPGHADQDGADAPLAVRMRPRTLDEFVGQQRLLGPGKPLRRAIEEDRLGSILLWDHRAPARPP